MLRHLIYLERHHVDRLDTLRDRLKTLGTLRTQGGAIRRPNRSEMIRMLIDETDETGRLRKYVDEVVDAMDAMSSPLAAGLTEGQREALKALRAKAPLKNNG